MVTQILNGTPKWVFLLFFVLAYYGYLQSRTRAATKARVLSLPIIMTLVSFGGVASSFGPHALPLLCWAAGLAAAIAANQVIRAPGGVTYDATAGRFHLPGSWTPLVLMMAIYFAKYTVGVMHAVRPDIAGTPAFAAGLSFLFGGFSGTFLARFLRIWQARGRARLPAAAEPEWRPAA